ncbi:MAG: hypothetical protein IJ795_00455 [Bacteroidales bacterium]|nr:hypothetical protein [Bacteroidales bacterium]
MSNTFDIKRFGKYFLWDLKQQKSNYGLNMLIVGCLPIIMYVICLFIGLISFQGHVVPPVGLRHALFWGGLLGITMFFSAKTYGRITDKRYGSSWLMLPASRLEKFLSMILIAAVVVPIAYMLLFALSDGLLSLVVPDYGQALMTFNINDVLFQGTDDHIEFTLRGFPLVWLAAAQNIMVFLLGALCFKKGKVGMIILISVGLSMLSSTIMSVVAMNLDVETFLSSFIGRFQSFMEYPTLWANLLISASSFFWIIASGVGIWFRLKTIKH